MQSRWERGRTVQAGAEVHGVAVASVPGHSASPDLHHVGCSRPQTLHLGRAVLRRHSVGHGLALKQQQQSPVKQLRIRVSMTTGIHLFVFDEILPQSTFWVCSKNSTFFFRSICISSCHSRHEHAHVWRVRSSVYRWIVNSALYRVKWGLQFFTGYSGSFTTPCMSRYCASGVSSDTLTLLGRFSCFFSISR